jgi:hypothetical protein
MTARLILLLALLGALILAYVIVLRVAPTPALPASARPSTGSPGESRAVRPIFRQGQLDPVTLTINIPPLAEFPAPWAETEGCPHVRITRTLRVSVGPAGGVPVLSVEPGGPADEAGIQPGDLLGQPGDCASSIYRAFLPGQEPRTIEWTVRRPRAAAQMTPAAEPPAAGLP